MNPIEQRGDLGAVEALPPPPTAEELPLPAGTLELDPRGHATNRFCPVCSNPCHANKSGDWRCYSCGAKGGTFKGKRMYLTHTPNTPEGRAAQARLAASW